MEPNTLASHSPPGSGSERTALPEESLRVPLADPRMSVEEGAATRVAAGVMTAPDLAVGGTLANGHATFAAPRANGSANGHAHSAWNGATRTAPAVSLARTDSPSLYLRGGKRVLDVVGALVGLVVTAPLLGLAALAVRIESHGPVLYRSKRVGRGGRTFTFYKLRSMVDGADRHRHTLSHLNETNGPVFKMSRDPRVTRVGRFLRTTSIDELPQLINVLRGDMSLVGPRPPLTEEVVQYEPWQLKRLEVRPGLTCLWQISGRSRIGFQEWMRLDLEYIRMQSFGLDLRILIRTIPAVLSREGAY